MAVDYTQIETPNWALSINDDGEVLTDLADIQQALQVIFNTRKGSDPLRPTFGTDIWRYLDRKMNEAVPNIKREMLQAVALWEPRAEIVSITHNINVSVLTFTVVWTATITGETVSTSFNFSITR